MEVNLTKMELHIFYFHTIQKYVVSSSGFSSVHLTFINKKIFNIHHDGRGFFCGGGQNQRRSLSLTRLRQCPRVTP